MYFLFSSFWQQYKRGTVNTMINSEQTLLLFFLPTSTQVLWVKLFQGRQQQQQKQEITWVILVTKVQTNNLKLAANTCVQEQH